uniref:hypothetical protein n=1 Tax=Candidatus Ichthyocystis hellenicum TaxID=1561003 RepID=UPI0011120627
MYPVPVTGSAATFSDPSESDGDGKGCVVQSDVSSVGLQQVEASTVTTSTTTVVGGLSTCDDIGKASTSRSGDVVSAPAIITNQDVCDLLEVKLHPYSAKIIGGLLSKADRLAGIPYKNRLSEQLPPSVSDKLTNTERIIWLNTYKVLCRANFVHRCFFKYYGKHMPGFIRSLPNIKVLSDSPGGGVEMLTGDRLLSFLSRLDSTIRGRAGRIFGSIWGEVFGGIYGSLEGESLDAVSCEDFIAVLDTAGIPLIASSSILCLKARYSRTKTNSKDVGKCKAPGDGSSSASTTEGRYASGSGVPAHVSTHSDTGIVCATVVDVQSIRYVDFLGFKLHPDSYKLISRLFHDVCVSAQMSYSCSMDNYLVTAMNSEISKVGTAIWCRVYRELHLSSFIARCMCVYHYKYRPDFIRALPSIRVLSSSSDSKPVPLSGGSLLGFLSKLDCDVTGRVENIFKYRWDKVLSDVLAELGDGSLSRIYCEDVINVLDVAGVPVVALSGSKRCKLKGKLSRAALSDLKRCKLKGKLSGAAPSDLKGRVGTASKSSTAAVSYPAISADQNVCDLLGVNLHPDSAQIVSDLLSKVDKLAGIPHKRKLSEQLPSNASDKLTATGLIIWCSTYKVLCRDNFVHRCFSKYYGDHIPDFIPSLPNIKVLSDSPDGGVETLTGDRLLSFLSRLDSAIRGRAECIFSSIWREVFGGISGALGGECLDAVNCKDFIDVLDIAGIPLIASSSTSNLKARCSRTNTNSKDVDKCKASGDGSSSAPTTEGTEGRYASSSNVPVPVHVYTYSETGIVCTTVREVLST